MITINSLTFEQVLRLGVKAALAGDSATARDCALLESTYIDSDCSELSACIDEARGEAREAAWRIVLVLRNAEARDR